MRPVTSLFFMAVIVLAGCGGMEEFHPPPTDLPTTWANGPPTETNLTTDSWWQEFGSTTLDELEKTALTHNQDLKAAVARLTQTAAHLRVAQAPLLPALEGKATDKIAQGKTGGSVRTTQLSLSASYEIDFWGKNAAAVTAATANQEADRFDYNTVALTLTADVATTYIKVLTLAARRKVTQQSREMARQTQALVAQQVIFGKASPLEEIQQRTAVAILEAQVAALALQYDLAIDALAILTGKPPVALQLVPEELAPLRLPTVLPGLPADLLQRRPDILRAEANLRAANADIHVARTALFPSVQLTGERGYASSALGSLLSPDSILWNLGAGLTAAIFDNGKNQGNIDLAEAKYTAVVAAYQQAVLAALQDVEDSLAAIHWLAEQEMAQATAAAAAQEALRLTEISYRLGAVDYLTVLAAQRTWLKAEDDLLQTHQGRLNAAIGLFKALGGGMLAEKEG